MVEQLIHDIIMFILFYIFTYTWNSSDYTLCMICIIECSNRINQRSRIMYQISCIAFQSMREKRNRQASTILSNKIHSNVTSRKPHVVYKIPNLKIFDTRDCEQVFQRYELWRLFVVFQSLIGVIIVHVPSAHHCRLTWLITNNNGQE